VNGDGDPRTITTVSIPVSELERVDRLAAALGVSRNRLVRAALLMAAYERPEKMRAWLGRLPRPHDWRERLLDVLAADSWRTLDELAAAVRARRSSFTAALDGLVEEGHVVRSGAGRRGSPLRYRRARRAELERALRERVEYGRSVSARIRAQSH
jgi:DNA-binding MarR family transcriptional regulator